MSLGLSFTDFAKVGELAWKVYRACKDARGDFLEISREVNTLHTVLKEVQDESNNDLSPLNRRGTCRKAELTTLVDNAENALKELDDIVNRYQRLGRKQKDVWIRARFATERLDSIRGKLTFHISAIGLFMSSLSTGTLGRIEEIWDDLVKEVRAGKREPSIISAHETNDVTVWQEIVTELASEGISRQEIARYKEDIKIYVKRVVGNSRSKPPSTTDVPTDVQLDGDDNNGESISQRVARTEGLDTAEGRGQNTGDQKIAATVVRLWYKLTPTSAKLIGAAGSGNLTLVKQLLKKGASISAKYGVEGVTAFYEAAFAGHEAVVQLLLDPGAEVDAKTDSRRSALHYAALVGHEKVARLSLKEERMRIQQLIGATRHFTLQLWKAMIKW
ncbi:hypothetical protein GJ744_005731 [Endocarpon pusillum]|uniref:Fungal N-terminal domain-containing protein n=1 Tax=Endocarpon pusillum TaxID=364733 RepID=A0A8H7APL9_9EURO|nr:hypothetical protein GJ744_005731 [Endocarpon pusillum]